MRAPTLVTAQKAFRKFRSGCKYANRLNQAHVILSVPAAVFLRSAVRSKAARAHWHGTSAVSGSDLKIVVAHPGICQRPSWTSTVARCYRVDDAWMGPGVRTCSKKATPGSDA